MSGKTKRIAKPVPLPSWSHSQLVELDQWLERRESEMRSQRASATAALRIADTDQTREYHAWTLNAVRTLAWLRGGLIRTMEARARAEHGQ